MVINTLALLAVALHEAEAETRLISATPVLKAGIVIKSRRGPAAGGALDDLIAYLDLGQHVTYGDILGELSGKLRIAARNGGSTKNRGAPIVGRRRTGPQLLCLPESSTPRILVLAANLPGSTICAPKPGMEAPEQADRLCARKASLLPAQPPPRSGPG